VLVARRMTRDLDRLVEGAQAAARGDLEHRVAVTSKDEVEAVASAFNLMMEDLRSAKSARWSPSAWRRGRRSRAASPTRSRTR